MSELAKHIQSINKANSENLVNGTFVMAWVEEEDHWAEYGICTPAQFDHYALAATAYDMHKDAYGFRCSWSSMNDLSDKELQETIVRLGAEIEAQLKWEAEEQNRIEREEVEHIETTEEILNTEHSVTAGLMESLLTGISL
jgi:hypothetical protein